MQRQRESHFVCDYPHVCHLHVENLTNRFANSCSTLHCHQVLDGTICNVHFLVVHSWIPQKIYVFVKISFRCDIAHLKNS